MRAPPHWRRVAFLALAVGSLMPAQGLPRDPGQPGERVDSVTFGAGVIESMGTVVDRQKRLAAVAATRAPTAVRGARRGAPGSWVIPSRRSHPRPHSAPHSLINKWGDTRMGIRFGQRVNFEGAWFGRQGGRGAWTTGVLVVGFRDGQEVARTGWFQVIGVAPAWFAAGLEDVDRIEIRSRPALAGAGWYALDDLTYRVPANGAGQVGRRIVVDFDDLDYRKSLTGTRSRYAGLTWERGTGDFGALDRGGNGVGVVPAPRSPRSKPAKAPAPTEPSVQRGFASGQNRGRAPNRIAKFVGPKLGDPGGASVPPDSCGACGLDHFVSVVNMNLSVFRKTDGVRVINVGHKAFWGQNVGDPRIVFDPHSRRFFASGMDGPAGNLYFAVSLTSDPTGSWFKTSWVAGVGSDAGTWPDFPTLGVDKRGVYLAALMVGRSTITIWAIHKAPLLRQTPVLGTVSAWRGLPWEGAVQPCVTYGDDGGEYLVSRRDQGRLRLRRIEGPLKTTPKLLERGFIDVAKNNRAPNAPALGSTVELSTGDLRPSFAVFRNGSIWTAQTVEFNGRAACRWYQLNPKTLRARQTGTVADPVRHYFYPSIAVNSRGDVAMGFSGSHAGQFAGAYYTGRLADDPPGEMGAVALLQGGTGAYNIVTGSGVMRWGDYSATTVDPVDDRTFWTIQEHARQGNIWGTRIGRLDFDWFPYGDGWAGTGGIPLLTLDGHPYLGTTPVIRIENSSGAATSGWLVVGSAPASLPFLDGTLLVQPGVAVGLSLPRSGASIPATIPNDVNLLQKSFYMQVLQVDSGASRGLAFSRGLEVRIGR